MDHLTFDELLMYAKRTIKLMRDDYGKMKPEYRELIEKVNNHINNCPECRSMLIKLQETNSKEEIQKLRNEKSITSYYNEKIQEYDVGLSNQYSRDSVPINTLEQIKQNNIEAASDIPKEIDGILINSERVKLYYEYPELLDIYDIVSVQEKEAYIKALENYEKILESRQTGASKDKPKVLIYKNPNSVAIEENERQAGFINLLLLSLTTGFAGGIITAIMLGMIR